MEHLLKDTPYNSYDDLFNAVYSKKAILHINRYDCLQIANTQPSFVTSYGTILGFIFSLVVLILGAISINNYWILLFIPFSLLLNYTIIYLPFIKNIAYLTLLSIFLSTPLWIIIIATSIIAVSIGYNMWWNSIYKKSLNILKNNKKLFLLFWDKSGISIEDSFGNIYSYLNSIHDPTYALELNEYDNSFEYSSSHAISPYKATLMLENPNTIDMNFFYNKQNPYNEKFIKNIDDVIEYLDMYIFDGAFEDNEKLEELKNKLT